jgi:hypothetical protein
MVIIDAQTLWVPGPLPGMNEILHAANRVSRRGGKRRWDGYAEIKATLTDLVCNLATRGRLRPVSRAHFSFRWQCPDRRHNPDNIVSARKFILDGMVKAKVIENDGWDQVAGFTDEWVVAARHGVLVTIAPAV